MSKRAELDRLKRDTHGLSLRVEDLEHTARWGRTEGPYQAYNTLLDRVGEVRSDYRILDNQVDLVRAELQATQDHLTLSNRTLTDMIEELKEIIDDLLVEREDRLEAQEQYINYVTVEVDDDEYPGSQGN